MDKEDLEVLLHEIESIDSLLDDCLLSLDPHVRGFQQNIYDHLLIAQGEILTAQKMTKEELKNGN